MDKETMMHGMQEVVSSNLIGFITYGKQTSFGKRKSTLFPVLLQSCINLIITGEYFMF
jgi:hypothetical protein